LTCFRQSVFGLRWFREDRDVPALARDCGISRATGYRYLDEVIEVLAAQAPDLHEALQRDHFSGRHVLFLGSRNRFKRADRTGVNARIARRPVMFARRWS
jgi:hypothetical protein